MPLCFITLVPFDVLHDQNLTQIPSYPEYTQRVEIAQREENSVLATPFNLKQVFCFLPELNVYNGSVLENNTNTIQMCYEI